MIVGESLYLSIPPSPPHDLSCADVMPEPVAVLNKVGQPLPLKVRLSIGQDLHLDFLTSSTLIG